MVKEAFKFEYYRLSIGAAGQFLEIGLDTVIGQSLGSPNLGGVVTTIGATANANVKTLITPGGSMSGVEKDEGLAASSFHSV